MWRSLGPIFTETCHVAEGLRAAQLPTDYWIGVGGCDEPFVSNAHVDGSPEGCNNGRGNGDLDAGRYAPSSHADALFHA